MHADTVAAGFISVLCNAQPPPVSLSFQPTYTELDNYLINFNATLPPRAFPHIPL